jgi:phosphoglycerol transferase MdoB-like AlkP superfamily enzyme
LRKIFITLILIINSILSLFNLIDAEYYKFTLKRSTADLFNLIFTGNDVFILLPQFIKDFWYIIFFWILLIFLLWISLKKYFLHKSVEKIQSKASCYFLLVVFFVIFSAFSFIVVRGTKLRPVNLLSASLYSNSTLVPLVLNTPFSIVKTFGKQFHTYHHYFNNEKELLFNPIYQVKTNFPENSKKKINVVLIILESFSKEHIGYFNKSKKSFTPFLDSLLNESLVITHSFANARKSIESLPAILASLPALMETPYILSPFSSNKIEALPAILKKYGYKTMFFHGGTNGTMGFDVFSSMAGIEQYFGRWEYPNQQDYDGNWGIWDEPYLQYVKKELDNKNQPFFAVIYTLSSHHPYKIPEKYINVFTEGEHEILKTIAYTDYSLKQFFKQAQKSPWFKNTLFVITADHVFGSHSDFYFNLIGNYYVPIAFYCYNDTNLKGNYNIIAQHCDIAPSILDYLGLNIQIFSFGSSIWDKNKERFAINYLNGTYMLTYKGYFVEFDGEKILGLFKFPEDSLLKNNLINSNLPVKDTLLLFTKSIIQQYDYRLINNKLIAE